MSMMRPPIDLTVFSNTPLATVSLKSRTSIQKRMLRRGVGCGERMGATRGCMQTRERECERLGKAYFSSDISLSANSSIAATASLLSMHAS
eukprot:5894351-Prymnesium_polylepis.2